MKVGFAVVPLAVIEPLPSEGVSAHDKLPTAPLGVRPVMTTGDAPAQLFCGDKTLMAGVCAQLITISSVTVVVPHPPDPVLDNLTVREPLGEVGLKPQAVMLPPPLMRVPVPEPPPRSVQLQEPGVEAEAPVNITSAVPH